MRLYEIYFITFLFLIVNSVEKGHQLQFNKYIYIYDLYQTGYWVYLLWDSYQRIPITYFQRAIPQIYVYPIDMCHHTISMIINMDSFISCNMQHQLYLVYRHWHTTNLTQRKFWVTASIGEKAGISQTLSEILIISVLPIRSHLFERTEYWQPNLSVAILLHENKESIPIDPRIENGIEAQNSQTDNGAIFWFNQGQWQLPKIIWCEVSATDEVYIELIASWSYGKYNKGIRWRHARMALHSLVRSLELLQSQKW